MLGQLDIQIQKQPNNKMNLGTDLIFFKRK